MILLLYRQQGNSHGGHYVQSKRRVQTDNEKVRRSQRTPNPTLGYVRVDRQRKIQWRDLGERMRRWHHVAFRLTRHSKSTYDRYLSACRIENGAASTGARDAHAPFLPVTQDDIHHCRHQRVVEGVVLGERRDAEILEHRSEREAECRDL